VSRLRAFWGGASVCMSVFPPLWTDHLRISIKFGIGCPHYMLLDELRLVSIDPNTNTTTSSVNIVIRLGLDARSSIPVWEGSPPPRDSVQTGYGAYPASYPMDTVGGSWSWPITPI
jgi:hypothetical protein